MNIIWTVLIIIGILALIVGFFVIFIVVNLADTDESRYREWDAGWCNDDEEDY